MVRRERRFRYRVAAGGAHALLTKLRHVLSPATVCGRRAVVTGPLKYVNGNKINARIALDLEFLCVALVVTSAITSATQRATNVRILYYMF